MPLILVGADTPTGDAIVATVEPGPREIRVFVTDERSGVELKRRGFKVATGDVSDESHVEAAALGCFSAVLIVEAAYDNRERAFASSAEQVMNGWARAVAGSGVTRVIWVTEDDYPETSAPEVTSVDPSRQGFVEKIIALDDAQSIS